MQAAFGEKDKQLIRLIVVFIPYTEKMLIFHNWLISDWISAAHSSSSGIVTNGSSSVSASSGPAVEAMLQRVHEKHERNMQVGEFLLKIL